MAVRFVVLASGSGSNLQAILDGCASGELLGEVAAVVTNKPGAFALERAAAAGVPTRVLVPDPGEPRTTYDARLAECVRAFSPDWVVLAGWMRLLTMAFLGEFPSRVVNLHPALPGEFPGTHAIERAFDEARAGPRDHTGVMVHLVPDEGVDDGPVLATATVPILPGDSLADLETRVHLVEHDLLVRTLARLSSPAPLEARHP
jgi:phosphoribosylglycinamide formyltransferase-1